MYLEFGIFRKVKPSVQVIYGSQNRSHCPRCAYQNSAGSRAAAAASCNERREHRQLEEEGHPVRVGCGAAPPEKDEARPYPPLALGASTRASARRRGGAENSLEELHARRVGQVLENDEAVALEAAAGAAVLPAAARARAAGLEAETTRGHEVGL